MTHLPYIAAAYVIAVGVTVVFCVEAWFRTRSARRRLQAIDTRRDRSIDTSRDRSSDTRRDRSIDTRLDRSIDTSRDRSRA